MDPYDLRSLFAFRETLRSLDPESPPALLTLDRTRPPCGAVAILSGSFNPPTAAHLLLAERARMEGFDCVLFALPKATAGKGPGGLIAEDRLLALRMIASPPSTVVAVFSHGLYAEQAEAAGRAFPGAEIAFLVGSDKVAQIFDPRWYADRDAALEGMFARARLLVSPRADDAERVRAIIAAPENARWSERIDLLPLHPAVSDLSSTRVRGLLQSGADPSGLVPPPVAAFLAEIRAFGGPTLVGDEEIDPYRLRARLLDVLWRDREWAIRSADLRALMRLMTGPGGEGTRLREWLSAGELLPADLARAQPTAT